MKKFFNDPSLSKDSTQSCASCHNSQYAFTDHRINKTSADGILPGAVSLGQDKKSLGDINTPSAPYLHNRIFKNPETIVHFYNTRDVKGALNPETQKNLASSRS